MQDLAVKPDEIIAIEDSEPSLQSAVAAGIQAVSNHWRNIQAGIDHDRHFVPGFVHLPPHVKTLAHPQFFLHVYEVFPGHVHRAPSLAANSGLASITSVITTWRAPACLHTAAAAHHMTLC